MKRSTFILILKILAAVAGAIVATLTAQSCSLTSELTKTKTGIDNIPNVSQTNDLRILCRDILEPLRDKIGKPIIINSAFRSVAVNRAVGGVSNSLHLLGQAADIHCNSLTAFELYKAIDNLVLEGQFDIGQCILYKNSHFVHVSRPIS